MLPIALNDTYVGSILALYIFIIPENLFSKRYYNSISTLSIHFVLLFPGYIRQEKEFPVCKKNRIVNTFYLLHIEKYNFWTFEEYGL